MNETDLHHTNPRDYSTISPSARALLLMKGHTDVPFAREAASLLLYPNRFEPDYANPDFKFWARVLHFEKRYKNINQLLWETSVHNILEICSGFSFRGLEALQKPGIHYIDTDLPGIITLKKSLIPALQTTSPAPGSRLEIVSMNALDQQQVQYTSSHFHTGPVNFVNEGLLMYLDNHEKEHLCQIIRSILQKRGGYWITGDIYIKNKHERVSKQLDDQLNNFFEEHRITEKMFDSFEEAELFFNKVGFEIDKEARTDISQLSSMPWLQQHATEAQLLKLQKAGRLQTTWRLKPIP
ncbi:Leucine carboxyl methyltransferase [Filimonas lacunae]|uniref:Leucine carboxyl methyltransferase n=1 Tax=Filimonas lacunae TaxID=477680 RepID=A0A173MLK5_9BACT|nr:class I SAM-dependent methyltransferase [Filimonas lacunae]BAV08349.1 hypothetical protein FLA_4385 [Filimonas lacunae]SIT33439.1 Leucine carboxyl methyltransferase [Filimonas lacunae]